MMTDGMTYAGSGVDYGGLDQFKRLAQQAAAETDPNISRLGLKPVPQSRGESAFLIDCGANYLAHVEEGLGTKNLVADGLPVNTVIAELTGFKDAAWASLAQDTVAMIVNDMITLGALPISVAMHLAVSDSSWFNNQDRMESLIYGWRGACDMAGCVWGGGETPALKGVIEPGTVLLSGSAVGIIEPKERLITANLQDGDAIVLLESSGIHANGLTLARKIADKTSYGAVLRDGRGFGESLLDPTTIYVKVMESILKWLPRIDVHYTANITGHGWRKLMRAEEPFVYRLHTIPQPHPVFGFIQEQGPVDIEEMYGNYNMGAGFAVYVRPDDATRVVEISEAHGIRAIIAGEVHKQGDAKKVVIEPLGIEYDGSTLGVR